MKDVLLFVLSLTFVLGGSFGLGFCACLRMVGRGRIKVVE